VTRTFSTYAREISAYSMEMDLHPEDLKAWTEILPPHGEELIEK
jgi:hypothetical protein